MQKIQIKNDDIIIENKSDMLKLMENTNNKNYYGTYNIFEYLSQNEVYRDDYISFYLHIKTKLKDNNIIYKYKLETCINFNIYIDNLQGKEKIKTSNILKLLTYNYYNNDSFEKLKQFYDFTKNNFLQQIIDYKIECDFKFDFESYD